MWCGENCAIMRSHKKETELKIQLQSKNLKTDKITKIKNSKNDDKKSKYHNNSGQVTYTSTTMTSTKYNST